MTVLLINTLKPSNGVCDSADPLSALSANTSWAAARYTSNVGGGLQLSTSGAYGLNTEALECKDLMQKSLGHEARTINMVELATALNKLDEFNERSQMHADTYTRALADFAGGSGRLFRAAADGRVVRLAFRAALCRGGPGHRDIGRARTAVADHAHL